MSKRRMFDIEFPSEVTVPAGTEVEGGKEAAAKKDQRRGPMATAISENAEALRARAEAEKHIRAENDRLAHEFVRLKKLGLVVDHIPLDAIQMTKLTRDRSRNSDPELQELKTSIQTIGLSNPIRVEEVDDGYELVQGFRRWSAYKELYDETGDEAFARIPAGLLAKGETLSGLYRRMVDENLVRRDISFAEMAQLAMSFADDPETECEDLEEAVSVLFASAGRQKRVYIRNFAELLSLTGGQLKFPEALPRALGLDLRKILLEDEVAQQELMRKLTAVPVETSDVELKLLRDFAQQYRAGKALEQKQTQGTAVSVEGPTSAIAGAKTSLRCVVPAGTVRCLARDGKVEMMIEQDFSAVEKHRLETAIQAFFAALED